MASAAPNQPGSSFAAHAKAAAREVGLIGLHVVKDVVILMVLLLLMQAAKYGARLAGAPESPLLAMHTLALIVVYGILCPKLVWDIIVVIRRER